MQQTIKIRNERKSDHAVVVRRKIVLYFLRKWDITGYMGI